MRSSQIAGIAVAAVFSFTSSAFAQAQPAQTKSGDIAATQTFTGCLMTERDYRRAHNLGDGPVGGAGLGDEYVLVDVKVSPAKVTTDATPRPDASGVASTSATAAPKCADQGTAYRLAGSSEEQLKGLVGRQIEIQGRFKDPTDTRAGEKMPNEVEMISFREAPAPAPAATTPPQGIPSPPAQTAPPRTTRVTPPPASTIDPETTPRSELPRTASPAALIGLIGVLALTSGVALNAWRRRRTP